MHGETITIETPILLAIVTVWKLSSRFSPIGKVHWYHLCDRIAFCRCAVKFLIYNPTYLLVL